MISRIEALRAELKENEGLLVISEANRRYLTGFPSSAGAVLITKEAARLLIDFRYFEKARAEVKTAEVVLCRSISEEIIKSKIKCLYIECETQSVAAVARLKNRLLGTFVSDSDKFDRQLSAMRAQKSEQEKQSIIAAQKITDDGFAFILNHIKEGKTEREIALELEFFMRKQGSEGVAFDFIVVSGENSSLPHGVPTDRVIRKGDFVTLDFGAKINGYCSDMTRTVAVGKVSEEQRAVYGTVLSAQAAAIAAIRAGAVCKDIDKIARDIIENAGYKDCFGHGLGHSVGLEIHESPACNTRDDTKMQVGTVMTVEPGIYLENRFGVRIEDMVYVTADGRENLTHSPKELIIL